MPRPDSFWDYIQCRRPDWFFRLHSMSKEWGDLITSLESDSLVYAYSYNNHVSGV